MNDNILRYLPENRELPFYEGCYYSLSELLKTVHDTHTRDLIKIKLCDLRNVIIKLNPNYRK